MKISPVGSTLKIFTAYPRRHETPNLDWNAAESRFSQLLYHGQTVQKLTESRFGISKFGNRDFLGICNYVELIDTIFTDVEGVD